MINIPNIIAKELEIRISQVDAVIKLKDEGGTVPFISRYRKEITGDLNEIFVRDIFDKYEYYLELEDRKKSILESIASQGKLTPELEKQILECLSKTILEDIYLPYKPKRRTRASIAREKGLAPLAEEIEVANIENDTDFMLKKSAEKYINSELEVNSIEEAISGASDILAEELAETLEIRSWLRDYLTNNGVFTSRFKPEIEVGSTKFENFRDYSVPINKISSHAMLALRRAENEKILTIDVEFDNEYAQFSIARKVLFASNPDIESFYTSMIKDSLSRLLQPSIIGEIRLERKQIADLESVLVFGENLRQALLAPPAGMKPTIGVDPGFRTGCKVVALDETGKFMEYQAIYPHTSSNQVSQARITLLNMIKKYKIELIAIGNGTASRETDAFVSKVIAELNPKPIKVIVNESGASIYSASKTAADEFPDLDLTIRGAISIARRLQDPLAELIKIDPKSIGVGQYQHDVDQKLLKKKLDEAVELCVNYVGVDVNTASKELLSYVAGINQTIAKNIVEFRNKNGKFKSRDEIKKVPRFGDKTFEQAAGFLRVRNGINPLDNTAVHPESYPVVASIAKDLKIDIASITQNISQVKKVDIHKYQTETFGEFTLRDIIEELEKPGRDPREQFVTAQFMEGVNEITDLKEGMKLDGVVTNITNFGAFVDIGVHQDGLVHISELSNSFVKDATKAVKVGQLVKVVVMEVNIKLKRISLSIKRAMQ